MNKITQAFVLAAGLGTRLRPLTDELPKPLIPIFQKPLITFALDHLIDIGITNFFVNTHRQPERFREFFDRDGSPNLPFDTFGAPGGRVLATRGVYRDFEIQLIHEPDLLETGGGIKNAERHLGSEPFLTYSGDILTNVELQPLIDEHFSRGNDVTLALRHTGLASAVALRDQHVVDISNRYGVPGNFDFANIAVWNSAIFERLPPRKKISFIPIIADWIAQGARIGGVVMNDGKWFNIGSRAEYLEVHRIILRENWKPDFIKPHEWPECKASSAIVDSSAQLRGCTVVGRNCRVGADAILEDTILWPDAEIASQSRLEACIVRSRKKITGIHRDIDI